MEDKPKKLLTPFTILNIVLFLSVMVSSFYFFYIKKNFKFIVETTCDPSIEQCFLRDCTNADDCPPNGFSQFKRYELNTNDFKYCTNEDCKIACESKQIKCEPIACSEDVESGESCSSLIQEQQIQTQ